MKLQIALCLGAVALLAASPAPAATSPAPASTSPAPSSTSPAPAATSPTSTSTSPALESTPAELSSTSREPASTSLAPAYTSPAPAATSPAPVTETDDDDCYDDFEYENNPELLERLKKYDVAKVLDGLGGAPGKVNTTWRERADVPESVPELDEDGQHLADNANSSYWLYQYASTDYETYIRLEHGLLRSKGTADERVDVHGEVWWTPAEGLCGALRHAKYRREGDAGRLDAAVQRAHCNIFRKSKELVCYGPDSENPCAFCISSVSGALIATLVG